MSNAKQTGLFTPRLREIPLHLLETFPGAFFFLDDAEIIVYANASAQAMIGIPRETLYRSSFWRGAPQLVSTALYQAVRRTKATQEPGEVEYVSPVTRTRLHVQVAPTVGGLALHVHEKRLSSRSQETSISDQPLTTDILENMYVGIGCLTPEGILLEINEAPLNDAQIRREEVIGHPFAETPWWTFYPDSQEQLRAAIARASRGETVRFETLVHPRAGMDLHLEATITPHRDENHHVAYLIYVGTDITERKQTEEIIQALVDVLPQLVWITNPDGRITYSNRRLLAYMAMTQEQVQEYGWLAGVHPDDRQRVWREWQTSLHTGIPYEMEHRLQDGTSGAYRWFLVRGVPRKNAQGTILHWVGTCTDIDEQKRMEEALYQSQERANVLMNSSIIGVFVYEEEQIVDANDTFLRMTGYTREDLQAGRMNWMHMTHPDDLTRTQQAHQELTIRQLMQPYEKEYVRKDGDRLPVLVGAVAFQHAPRQGIAFVLDNSARKELEQRKDDFINMASHELRTPLTALKMQTQLVRKRLEKQSQFEAAAAISRMEGPVKQLERLIGELLDVSKIQASRLEYVQEPVELDAVLREVVDTMHHLHPGYTILVRGIVQTRLIGDRDRLGQVFTNLLSNAIKYSPGAKIVEMDLSETEEAITIRVHDHGPGIPREQRDRIFERFYRVIAPGQKALPGLGMGLYIVAEIVKHHGGTIAVDSVVGEGSTFTVILPRTCSAKAGDAYTTCAF